MSKKILLLSTVHPSGHARYHGKIARSLADADYEVETWARGENRPTYLSENVNVRLIPAEGKIKRMFYLPILLSRALFANFDLVVVVPPETVVVGLIARLFGKRVIWDVEEDGTSSIHASDWIPSILRKPVSFIYSLVERLAAVTMNGISYAEDNYAPRFYAARRKTVTHNYPWKPEGEDLSSGKIADERWKLPGPRLIYVGEITYDRGILDVINTVALLEDRLPDIRFDVVGGIPSKQYREQLEQAISRLKNPGRVTLYGRVPFDTLDEYLKKAQIGVVPLWPLPNHLQSELTKPFEYCLAGLPMVVGDNPPWRRLMDVADSGEAAKFRDLESWAFAIEKLWSRGSKKLKFAGKRAHDMVFIKNCFWESEAERFIQLCEDVMRD